MITLYTNGDSWTQGDELGLPYKEHETEAEQYYWSWPWQLHKLLGTTMCFNDAVKGTSNNRIFRRTTNFIRNYNKHYNPRELIVVVCWTTLDRDEIPIDVNDTGWHIPIQMYGVKLPNHSEISKLDATTTEALNQIHKPYTMTLPGIKVRSELQYSRMWNLKQICDSLGIKLIQSWALDIPQFDPTHNDFVKQWIDDIKYLPEIFINYCRKKNYPLGPGGHCYKDGHEGWAKYIYENI
jgi:hypothetical protein